MARTEPKQAAPAKQRSTALTIAQRHQFVMDGFQGEFRRPRTTLTYRLGLFFSSFVAMILPLIYVSFIVAIAWLVYLHLRYNITIFEQTANKRIIGILAVYLAPAIVGTISIAFMVKPLLAPTRRESRPRSLSPESEPVLFDFVKRICDDVKSPLPKRIDIDSEVNASASFRNGWWSLIRGNDLVLTIGMPLVAGMSARQFAGVLAHEFGHFSQGAGMRLTYLLRSVNHWFMQVIYERDAWDDWLDQACKNNEQWVSIIFYLAKAAVWLSRQLLWCLFVLGNLLTGFIQQQMEYDADRYEIAMAGRATFQSSFRALQMLSAGFSNSSDALQRTLQENRLIDNIPKFVHSQAKKLPNDLITAIDDAAKDEKTGLFDSHPCDKDRIAAADNATDEGRYVSVIPASALFMGFEQACRLVTRDFYKDKLEVSIDQANWISTDSVVAEESAEDEAWQAVLKLGEDCLQPHRPLELPGYVLGPSDNPKLCVEVLRRANKMIEEYREAYRDGMNIKERAESIQDKKRWITDLEPCVKIIDRSILNEETISNASKTWTPNIRGMNLFPQAVAARTFQAGILLYHHDVTSRLSDSQSLKNRIEKVAACMAVMEPMLDQVALMEERLGYFTYCLGHLETNNGQAKAIFSEAARTGELILAHLVDSHSKLQQTPYPYEHAQQGISIGDVFLREPPDVEDVLDIAEKAANFIGGFFQLRGRCLGTLMEMTRKVEVAVGVLES